MEESIKVHPVSIMKAPREIRMEDMKDLFNEDEQTQQMKIEDKEQSEMSQTAKRKMPEDKEISDINEISHCDITKRKKLSQTDSQWAEIQG